MTDNSFPPIFDGHNDTILNLYQQERGAGRSFFKASEVGHIDLPRARAGGLAGGFFAMFTPNPAKSRPYKDPTKGLGDNAETFEIPLPPRLKHKYALRYTHGMLAQLLQIVEQAEGELQIVRTAAELETCLQNDIFAIVLHIEGAEAIDTNLDSLHVFHAAGLRSLGPVWSRPTKFAEGVPFAFPAGPDIGEGLTEAGVALTKACNKLNIMIDLSHLNEKGFWDIARLSDAPLVATHSNAYALCPSPRNLTDKQLDAVAESGGVVGINYHVGFLREDGNSFMETSLTEIVRHARYIADRIGIDHVALGSDFDGAKMPDDLKDAAGLPKLMTAFQEAGFDDNALAKIAYQNWVRVGQETWGA
ncbi:MAG: dipeptidase [Chloroflexota bacterium]